MTTNEALAIIDETADQAFEVRGGNDRVVAALKHLTDLGIERETLVWFWESLKGENDIGRDQNANASRNRIKHLVGQLRRPSR